MMAAKLAWIQRNKEKKAPGR